MALRQGGTRLTGCTYPNLVQARGGIKYDMGLKPSKIKASGRFLYRF